VLVSDLADPMLGLVPPNPAEVVKRLENMIQTTGSDEVRIACQNAVSTLSFLLSQGRIKINATTS
jgi:hypothetical protein